MEEIKKDRLRLMAEKILKEKGIKSSIQYSNDLEKLVQELNIYQIELEHQNTELAITQQKLEESHKQYTDLFENAPLGYLTLNEEGEIIKINKAAASHLNNEKNELLNKKFNKFIHPNSQDIYYFHTQNVIKNGDDECQILIPKNGKDFYFKLVSKYSELNKTMRISLTDITHIHNLQVKVNKEKEFWEKTFASTDEGVFLMHEDYSIFQCNEAFGRIVGMPLSEIIGKKTYQVMHGTNTPPNYCATCKAIDLTKQQKSDYWEPHLKKHLKVSADPVLKPNGELDFLLNFVQDITIEKNYEKELIQSKERAELRNTIANAFLTDKTDKIYSKVLNIILKHFNCEFGYFGYINDEGDLVSASMTYDIWDKCNMPEKDIIFPKSSWSGLWGKSLKEKKALLQNVGLKLPEGHVQLKNAMVVPILSGNKLIGQIALGNKQSDFTHVDKEKLVRTSSFIAPILQSKLQEQKLENEKAIALNNLKDKSEELNNIITHSNQLFYIHDTQNVIQYVSPQCKKIVGYSPKEMKINWTNLVTDHPVNLEGIKNTLKALETGEKQPAYLLELGHKNKKKIWVEVDESPYKDENGNVIGMVGSLTDITEKKRAQDALKESEERFKFLSNVTFEGIIVHKNAIAVDVNESLLKLLGYQRNDIIGKSVLKFIPKNEDIAVVKNNINKEQVIPYRISVERKDKSQFIAEIEARNIIYKGEKLRIAAVRDITVQVNSEKALKESEEKLRAIIEHFPNGSVNVYNKKFELIIAEGQDYKNFNINPDDLIGRSVFAMQPKELAEKANDALQRAFMGETYHYDIEYQDAYFHNTAFPIKLNGNEIEFAVIIATNITERKLAEYELKMNERRLESLVRIGNLKTESTQELLDFALTQAIDLTNSKIGYIYYYNEQTKQFSLNSWSKEVMNECTVLEPQTIYNLESTGCWGEAVRQRKPIVINDYKNEKELKKGTPKGHVKLNKFLTIPVFDGDNIVAVVGVANKIDDYDDSDIRQLNLMMNTVWKIVEKEKTKEELKIAKVQAEASEERLKLATVSGQLGIWEWNVNENILIWDDKMFELYGVTRDTFSNAVDAWKNGLHPEDKQRAIDELNAALKGEKDFNTTFRVIHPDGTILYIKADAIVIRDKDNQALRMIGINKDITKSKHAELELIAAKEKAEESEIKFRSLFETMQEGVYLHEMIYDKKGNAIDYKIIEANPISEKYLNIKVQDAVGKLATELYQTPEAPFIDIYEEVSKSGKPHTFEQYFEPMDKWFYISVFSPKKGIFATTFLDITANKKAEEDLIAAKEKAEESDRLKSAFLSNMSHEIRTPMNSIIGFSSLLNNDNLANEKRKKYVEIIQNNSHDLLRIINDILDISKLEAKQLKIFNSEVNLYILLKEIVEIQNQNIKAKQKEIQLIDNCTYTCNVDILADSSRLKQVLNNIIDNAIKFTDNGYVELSCTIVEDEILFKIKDTGIGIESDKVDTVFERFNQVGDNMTRRQGGNGLGLAICKGIIELMGGEIWAESQLHQGTTFYFTIPLIKANNQEVVIEDTLKTTEVNFTKKNVLIVEDDEGNAELLINYLEPTGVKIFLAVNGKEALETFEKHKHFDAILMDINLPDISGLEVTKRIKAKEPRIPIISQTAFAMQNEKEKFLNAGFDDYLSKPINSTLLIEKLSFYMRRKNK